MQKTNAVSVRVPRRDDNGRTFVRPTTLSPRCSFPPDDLLEHARAGHDAGIPAGLLLFHQENIGKAGCIKDVPYRFTDIGNDHRIFPEFMVCHQQDTQTG